MGVLCASMPALQEIRSLDYGRMPKWRFTADTRAQAIEKRSEGAVGSIEPGRSGIRC